MKKIFLSGYLVFTIAMAYAQTVQINGTVKDASGKPVIFAFLVDSQHPYATFSDSTGAFVLKAERNAVLIVTADQHPALQVKIESPNEVKIIMAGDSPSNGQNSTVDSKKLFSVEDDPGQKNGGSVVGIGSNQQPTHGSRFLFDDWVHGFAVTSDNVIKNDNYVFNYDKIGGSLVFSKDRTSLHQSARQEVASFTLFDDKAQPYVFVNIPAIDPHHYVQLLSSGEKYNIYKVLNTKFTKANFTTNGISSSGNNYDEFAEDPAYYVVKLPGGVPQKISLKKKSIKAAFPAEADKINKYLNDNDRDYDDNYLKGLGDFMNQ